MAIQIVTFTNSGIGTGWQTVLQEDDEWDRLMINDQHATPTL